MYKKRIEYIVRMLIDDVEEDEWCVNDMSSSLFRLKWLRYVEVLMKRGE
mgnify:CR=1 FL=1|tara:strand:- start:292 stop:438 length:147 start_codon:yes stop_codon:yes gene_type:complete